MLSSVAFGRSLANLYTECSSIDGENASLPQCRALAGNKDLWLCKQVEKDAFQTRGSASKVLQL